MASPESVPHHRVSSEIRFLAILAGAAAAYWTASILVPLLLGLVLAIALAPLADHLERLGANRTIASLSLMVLVALVLAGASGLIAYQVGVMVKQGGRSIDRLGDVSARAIRSVGGEAFLKSVTGEPETQAGGRRESDRDEGDALVAQVRSALRRHAGELGRWAAAGVNGVLGIAGNTVIVLAFLFYMLQDRDRWVDRLKKAALGLGMRPRDRELREVGHQVRHYLGALLLVSGSYALVLSPILWLIGVPQPFFWGVLTAILELVPFFGPIVAGTLTTLAALGAGGAWWQPAATVGVFLAVGMVEGYVVTPLLYGKAVEIDPVTVLFGVMLFGFLLGPAGLALAMSMMILLRGALVISPDTPAMDALADAGD